MIHAFVFYGFGGLAVLSSFLIITRTQPVTAIMWFLGLVVSLAGIFVSLQAEFLGMMQLFLYGDAITVIFLFVIMAMNIPQETLPEENLTMSSLLLLGFTGLFLMALAGGIIPAGTNPDAGNAIFQGFDSLASQIFGSHLLAFEMLTVLLLIGVIGVVVLSRKQIAK